MKMSAFGKSDKGRVRPHNEDAMHWDTSRGLFAVADGMGGHAAGEVASRLAIEAVKDLLGAPPVGAERTEDLLRRTVDVANQRIAEKIRTCPEYYGMGTTLVIGIVDGDRLCIAHVGDSRAYLVRNGEIRQLTTDHSLVNELVKLGILSREKAASDPRRNVVTRALGSGMSVAPDVIEERLLPGDVVLLCSDGLNTMLADGVIQETIDASAGDLDRTCVELVDAANRAGGEDNVTVVLARPVGAGEDSGESSGGEPLEEEDAGADSPARRSGL